MHVYASFEVLADNNNFYTNKKALSLKTYSLNNETKTNLIAHNDNDNTNSDAKIQQKYDTAKNVYFFPPFSKKYLDYDYLVPTEVTSLRAGLPK